VLDEAEVTVGMDKERAPLKAFHVYDEVPIAELPPGTKVIGTRWVLVRKSYGVKARLVAQEVAAGAGPEDVFAGCPTLIGQRLLLQRATERGWAVKTGDISTAFLHAPVDHEAWVRPPRTEPRHDKVVWRLRKALYGLRTSPRMFQQHLAERLARHGVVRLLGDCQLYLHTSTGALLSIHTDDLLICAPDLKLIQSFVEAEFTVKWGDEIGMDSWVRYLGREFRRVSNGFLVRTPEKYVQKLLLDAGMEQSRAVSTPAVPLSAAEAAEEPKLLTDTAQVASYRRAVGRLMWMLYERPDLCYATKELSRDNSKPSVAAWGRLKRVLRYLQSTAGHVLALTFDPAAPSDQVQVVTDASWASQPQCRSTSGGAVWFRGFLLGHWSRTQPCVALSSCESEWYAMIIGAQEGKLAQSVLSEVGPAPNLTLFTDSASAAAVSVKRGLGRLKHMNIRQLWLQDAVRNKELEVKHMSGDDNVSDMFTKALGAPRLCALCAAVGMQQDVPPAVSVPTVAPVWQAHAVEADDEQMLCPLLPSEATMELLPGIFLAGNQAIQVGQQLRRCERKFHKEFDQLECCRHCDGRVEGTRAAAVPAGCVVARREPDVPNIDGCGDPFQP
jgi:hypothetical protein